MKITKKIILGFASLLVASFAMADGDLANGKKLFTAAECNKCHGTDMFTRPNRKVIDLKSRTIYTKDKKKLISSGLESMVRLCDTNLDTAWFDDEVIDVTAYLNQQFYKFK